MKLRLHIQFRCVKKQVIHRDTRDAHRSYPAAVQDHDFSPLMGHHVARWQFRDEPFSGHTDRPPGGDGTDGTWHNGMGQMILGPWGP
jgi:hypothetical protein